MSWFRAESLTVTFFGNLGSHESEFTKLTAKSGFSDEEKHLSIGTERHLEGSLTLCQFRLATAVKPLLGLRTSILVCMSVLAAYIYVHHVHIEPREARRPGHPGTGVTDLC